jgi:sugar lactone lactonase YvrE
VIRLPRRLARRSSPVVVACVAALGVCSAARAAAPTTYSIEHYAGTPGVSGNPTTGLATSVVFNDTWSTAVDAAGNVYVADYSGDVVDKISPSGYLSIIAGQSQQNGNPTPGPATATTLKNPTSIAVDSAGDIYFTDFHACEVDEINPAGHLSIIAGDGTCATTTAGPATNAMNFPYGIAINPSGTIYFSDQNDDEVWKIDSGTLVRVAGTGSPGAPLAGAATSSPLNWPQSIAFNTAGDLYVADNANSDVEEITPAGALSVIAGTGSSGAPLPGPASSSPLNYPEGVTVDSAGDVFVSDSGNTVVEEITPDGNLSVVAGHVGTYANPTFGGEALSSSMNYPVGLSVAPNGVLYVGDDGAATVDALVPDQPAASAPPTVSGTPAVGQTVSATTGSWSNQPLSYSYQWQDCDPTGVTCTDITGATASMYTATTSDVGRTLRVIVTAHNAGGTTAAHSVITAVVPAPAATSTTATTPTPVSSGPEDQIAPSIAGTPAIGQLLQANVGGWSGASLTYQYQWLRDGVAIPGATSIGYRVSTNDSGHQLSVEVIASDGTTTVSATSQAVLALAIDVRGCSAPTGRLTANAIGSVRLGMTRATARGLVKSTQPLNGYTDNLCLAGGYGIRVGYANHTMLGHGPLRRTLSSRIVFATTANPYYTLNGARPGMTVASVTKRLHLARPIHIGPNTWYVIPNSSTNHVLKTRGGVIQEIGDLNRALTRTRDQQGRLLRYF